MFKLGPDCTNFELIALSGHFWYALDLGGSRLNHVQKGTCMYKKVCEGLKGANESSETGYPYTVLLTQCAIQLSVNIPS